MNTPVTNETIEKLKKKTAKKAEEARKVARTLATKAARHLKNAVRNAQTWNWKVIALSSVALPLLTAVYWHVNSHGLGTTFDILATPLHKVPLPFLHSMKQFEGFHLISLSHVISMFLLFFNWILWIRVMHFCFYGCQIEDNGLNRKSYYSFLFTLATIIIIGDGFIFFAGLNDHLNGWSNQKSYFVPAVATLLYMAMLAAVAFFHVQLSRSHDLTRPKSTLAKKLSSLQEK